MNRFLTRTLNGMCICSNNNFISKKLPCIIRLIVIIKIRRLKIKHLPHNITNDVVFLHWPWQLKQTSQIHDPKPKDIFKQNRDGFLFSLLYNWKLN